MRGIASPVTDVRRKVFTEVARMSYEGEVNESYATQMRRMPFRIVPASRACISRTFFWSVPSFLSVCALPWALPCARWTSR